MSAQTDESTSFRQDVVEVFGSVAAAAVTACRTAGSVGLGERLVALRAN